MKKSEMIEAIAKNADVTKADAEKVFNATFDLFKDELAKGERAAREGRNPATGEPMKIAASKGVSFKAGTALKEVVNK